MRQGCIEVRQRLSWPVLRGDPPFHDSIHSLEEKVEKAMSVLVTGSGIIGCQIAKQLAARGERVILLDIAPAMDRVSTIVAPGTVNVVQGDVVDYEGMENLVRAE